MKVSEIMTPNVISVDESVSVREVAQMLNRHRISGLPVCDGHGHMTGLITEYDLIAKSDARNAGEAMSRDVIAVMEDTSVDEVRFLLVHRKIKRVPVLRGQKLVGIVSRADLVREIALDLGLPGVRRQRARPQPARLVPEVRHAQRLRAHRVAASRRGRRGRLAEVPHLRPGLTGIDGCTSNPPAAHARARVSLLAALAGRLRAAKGPAPFIPAPVQGRRHRSGRSCLDFRCGAYARP